MPAGLGFRPGREAGDQVASAMKMKGLPSCPACCSGAYWGTARTPPWQSTLGPDRPAPGTGCNLPESLVRAQHGEEGIGEHRMSPPPWSRTGWTAPVVKTVRALRLAVTGVVDQQDCPRASTQAHELGPLGQGGQGAAAVTEPHQPGEAMRSTWLSPAAIASTSRATGAGSTVPACRRGRCGGRSRTGGPDIGYRAAWWSRAMSLSITGSRGWDPRRCASVFARACRRPPDTRARCWEPAEKSHPVKSPAVQGRPLGIESGGLLEHPLGRRPAARREQQPCQAQRDPPPRPRHGRAQRVRGGGEEGESSIRSPDRRRVMVFNPCRVTGATTRHCAVSSWRKAA